MNSATAASVNVNRPATVLAVVILASITPSVLLFAPAIVGAMVTELGFSLERAGYLISMELAGMAFATVPGLYWINRLNWRTAVYVALIAVVIGNIASLFYQTFHALAVIRFTVGFFGGSIMLVGMTTIGMAQNQERLFALWVVGQIVFGTVGLAVLPHLLPVWGIQAFFGGLACLLVLLLPLVRYFPSQGAKAEPQSQREGSRSLLLGILGLLSVFLFYVAIGGVWAFMERMAAAADFDPKSTGYTLSVASFFGIVGAMAASGLGNKMGRAIPMAAGLILVVVSMSMLFGLQSTVIFLLSASIFKCAWTFTLPFLLACITTVDPSGRLIVATNLVIGAGLAAGPAIAGATLSEAGGFAGLLSLGIVCAIACCALMLPLSRIQRPEVVPQQS